MGADKQKDILAAALRLFVADGFHGTPTSKIAQEAGVANGTLFHYFKTKEELIVALYIHIKEQLNTRLAYGLNRSDAIRTRFNHIFVSTVHWSLENRDEFYFIQQFHFSPHLAQVPQEAVIRLKAVHQNLLQDTLQAKILKPLPIELIGTLVNSHIYGLHQYLLQAALPAARQKKIIQESFDLLFNMITQ